ncbi:hypothetical protein [Chitinophaga barathri]|uniref:Nucleotidyltransferase family protein n=1 Tax=Chitinophaga barathri TaxID=1647451 RepID=A0A3N4MF83_9BACT|nr:hypothetical protein [Chitinophaga barathri]RPD38309.1 hypothetical protein EG028_25825 [Chitinophaga barathri]
MDLLDEELIRFWRTLNEKKVRYIMVGGFATRFHGFNRSTEDLDMWLEDTLENRKRLRAAFVQLGYGDLEPLETIPFIPGFSNITICKGIELDILGNMKGLEQLSFDECLQMASIADIEGVAIPFLHINHLIENKKVVNRPKDQIDVIELEKIRKIRDEEA